MLPVERAYAYSKADALAIDALFKRIAERGRKIRNQNKTANNPLGKATLSVGQGQDNMGKNAAACDKENGHTCE